MTQEEVENAKKTAAELLVGAQLDRFTVSSLIVSICFVKLPKVAHLPVSIWLSASGQTVFLKTEGVASKGISIPGEDDFFAAREKLLGQLYTLIGKEITAVDIDPSGVLELRFENGSLVFAGDDTDLEEIWTITSDTPEPYGDQPWAVVLTDERDLVTRKP